MSSSVFIRLDVMTDDEQIALKVTEALARVMVGFGLEGIYTSMSVSRYEDEPDAT